MTITPLQFACSGKAPVPRAVYLSMSTALEKKSRKGFYAARNRRPLSNDVPEHLFFLFFFIFKTFLMIFSVLVYAGHLSSSLR